MEKELLYNITRMGVTLMEYFLLDVFTTEKFGGNQLAVFTNQQKNEKLLPEQMQKNCSRTKFI